jgi:hypothetical protein
MDPKVEKLENRWKIDKAISGLRWPILFNEEANTKRVLKYYNYFFKEPLIEVLQCSVDYQTSDIRTPDVLALAEDISEEYGVKTIVDGGAVSNAYTRVKEWRITLNELTKDQIESIPELSLLISCLKINSLDDVVWKVFGGNPGFYFNLQKSFSKTLSNNNITNPSVVLCDNIKEHIKDILYQT